MYPASTSLPGSFPLFKWCFSNPRAVSAGAFGCGCALNSGITWLHSMQLQDWTFEGEKSLVIFAIAFSASNMCQARDVPLRAGRSPVKIHGVSLSTASSSIMCLQQAPSITQLQVFSRPHRLFCSQDIPLCTSPSLSHLIVQIV